MVSARDRGKDMKRVERHMLDLHTHRLAVESHINAMLFLCRFKFPFKSGIYIYFIETFFCFCCIQAHCSSSLYAPRDPDMCHVKMLCSGYDFFGSCTVLLFKSFKSMGLKDFRLLLGFFSTYSSTTPRSMPDT